MFFSTHKMCWWLVISVSQFLQDLSKYRDALHGRRVLFMIQVSSPAFDLTQFSPDQSWYPSVHSFCTITLGCVTLFYFKKEKLFVYLILVINFKIFHYLSLYSVSFSATISAVKVRLKYFLSFSFDFKPSFCRLPIQGPCLRYLYLRTIF